MQSQFVGVMEFGLRRVGIKLREMGVSYEDYEFICFHIKNLCSTNLNL